MGRIYRCHENINSSFISNNSTVYISNDDKLEKKIKLKTYKKEKKFY